MTRRIALLRGVNVGGRNKLPMAQFSDALAGLGCVNIRTYIQSGNAVFDGEASAGDIAAAVKRASGVSCRAFVLTAAVLKKAAAACPFRKEGAASGKSVHVIFLDATPAATAIEALGDLRRPREDFAVAGKTLYLHSPEGVANSKIAAALDRTLGVASTARNWNTIAKLLELAEAA